MAARSGSKAMLGTLSRAAHPRYAFACPAAAEAEK
jgi:hypothetical protein